MHAVVSNLLAGLLLIHAMLGCCWHSAHTCTRRDRDACPVVKKVCCHHCHHKQQSENPPAPCKCRVECKGVCTYLPTERIQIDGTQLASSWQHLVVLPVMLEAPCASNSNWKPADGVLAWQPPLRLHLLHQIILI